MFPMYFLGDELGYNFLYPRDCQDVLTDPLGYLPNPLATPVNGPTFDGYLQGYDFYVFSVP